MFYRKRFKLPVNRNWITFNEITTRDERKRVQNIYNDSVPQHEKIYFYPLWFKRKEKSLSFLSVRDGDDCIGFIYYIVVDDLVYIWLYSTVDSGTTRDYDKFLLEAFKAKFPNFRIGISISTVNTDGENKEKFDDEMAFYQALDFIDTGYYTYEEKDSFAIMIYGGEFEIEEFYRLNRLGYPLMGKLFVKGLKKQIRKKGDCE